MIAQPSASITDAEKDEKNEKNAVCVDGFLKQFFVRVLPFLLVKTERSLASTYEGELPLQYNRCL